MFPPPSHLLPFWTKMNRVSTVPDLAWMLWRQRGVNCGLCPPRVRYGVVQRHTQAKNSGTTEDLTGCALGTTEEHRSKNNEIVLRKWGDLSRPSQQAFRLILQLQWAQMKEVWLYLGRSLAWDLPWSFLRHSSLFFTREKKKSYFRLKTDRFINFVGSNTNSSEEIPFCKLKILLDILYITTAIKSPILHKITLHKITHLSVKQR